MLFAAALGNRFENSSLDTSTATNNLTLPTTQDTPTLDNCFLKPTNNRIEKMWSMKISGDFNISFGNTID